MRPSENIKNNYATKAPAKIKESPLRRLPIKKTYCTKCQMLVKGQLQGSGNTVQIICPRCSQGLWFWNRISWRNARSGVDASS
jgi:hypothetical protein